MPRDPSWTQLLGKSDGAVIVIPSKVTDVQSKIVVDLARDVAIHDPKLTFRGKTILATVVTSALENPHEELSFWKGSHTAEARTPWNCRLEQGIDLSKKYLLLLSVDGPYTLEPIYGDDDPWLAAVRSYFATADRHLPTIHLNNNVLRQMRAVSIGSCEVHGAQPSYQEFLACVGKIYPKGPHEVLLEINGGSRMTAGLSEDGSRIPGEELVKIFGTNFGLADGVSLKALVENK